MDVGALLLIALVIVLVAIALVNATRNLDSAPAPSNSGELGIDGPHPPIVMNCPANCRNDEILCRQGGGNASNCTDVYNACLRRCPPR